MLFEKLIIKDVEIKNRIFVSPMCQYSSKKGYANNWHMVHLGSRAVGGAGVVIFEASAVTPEGRISPSDLGIWSTQHSKKLKPIVKFIKSQGSVPAIQLAHAGRKASVTEPWVGNKAVPPSKGGWITLAPSPVKFSDTYPEVKEMTIAEMEKTINYFADAATYAVDAGFEIIEIHAAHGYLLHQFLSPASNKRTDNYGGSLENRMRFPLAVIKAVKESIPENMPLFVRISATDWTETGWTIDESILFSKELKKAGVDFIDCSSGGNILGVKIPVGPHYQVEFAERIKKETGILTGAVGLITSPEEAEEIISSGKADAVLIAREFLRNPYWPLQAAKKLGVDVEWPKQYLRAKD